MYFFLAFSVDELRLLSNKSQASDGCWLWDEGHASTGDFMSGIPDKKASPS